MLAEKLLVNNWSNKTCFFLGDFHVISSIPQLKVQAQAGSILSIQAWPPQGPCRSVKEAMSKKLCDQHVVGSQDQKLLNQLTGNWRLLVEEWSFFSDQTSM